VSGVYFDEVVVMSLCDGRLSRTAEQKRKITKLFKGMQIKITFKIQSGWKDGWEVSE
jgi:hypothetical protein